MVSYEAAYDTHYTLAGHNVMSNVLHQQFRCRMLIASGPYGNNKLRKLIL